MTFSFQDFHNKHKKLSRKDWKKNVKHFCHRFPGHPNCRYAIVVLWNNNFDTEKERFRIKKSLKKWSVNSQEEELESFCEESQSETSVYFIPNSNNSFRIHIEDPLASVDPKLKAALDNPGRGFGHLSSEHVGKIRVRSETSFNIQISMFV